MITATLNFYVNTGGGENFVSEVKRKKNESFEAFFRRVKKDWMASGRVLQVRKVQFFTKKPSKNVQKTQTVSKASKISKTNYLRKIGRLPAEDPRQSRRRRQR